MSTRIGFLRDLVGPTNVASLKRFMGPTRVDSVLRLIVPTRVDLLNYLITTGHYRSYLEIGIAAGASFEPITAADKTGVDPYLQPGFHPTRGKVLALTSDDFFARNDRFFDLIYVDGDHHVSQVWRDTLNALRWLNPGGAIVLHDCLPLNESEQSPAIGNQAWTGQPWKVIANLYAHTDLPIAVGNFDHGCGVILPPADQTRKKLNLSEPNWEAETWRDYERGRNEILNVLSWKRLKVFIQANGLNGSGYPGGKF